MAGSCFLKLEFLPQGFAPDLPPTAPLLLLIQEGVCSAQTPSLVQSACALLCPIHHPTCQHGSAHPAPWGLWSCTVEGSKQKFQDGAERNKIANHLSFYRKRSKTNFSTVLEKNKVRRTVYGTIKAFSDPSLTINMVTTKSSTLPPPPVNRDSLLPF